MSSPLQATLAGLFCKIQLLQKSDKRHLQGAFINVVTGALQGALLIPFTFRLLQPFEVFSLDRTTLLLHSYPSTLKTGSRSRKTFTLLDRSNNTATQLYSKSTQWFLRYLCM